MVGSLNGSLMTLRVNLSVQDFILNIKEKLETSNFFKKIKLNRKEFEEQQKEKDFYSFSVMPATFVELRLQNSFKLVRRRKRTQSGVDP